MPKTIPTTLLGGCASAAVSLFLAMPAQARTCAELKSVKLPDTTIECAVPVAPGQFAEADAARRARMPGFCRVVASVKSAPGSDIRVEVWLPDGGWNGVFHGTGNGGFGGALRSGYSSMTTGVMRGYVSATTDTGTAPSTTRDADALIGQPQKWKDWGLLSTHVMTVTGKAVAKALYGTDASRSYYTGCSTGGQQGLIEAQFYPDDYNGILVGAPVINRTWGHGLVLWNYINANRAADRLLSESKLALLHKAVLANCGDKGSGLAGDPFVGDPLACKFDPAVLTCRTSDTAACLTPGEVENARSFYSGPLNRAGRPSYVGWLRGSEAPGRSGWAALQTTPNNEPAFGSLFKWVFGAGFDWRTFDFDRDMPKVDALLGPSVNMATKADMTKFQAKGGKLIVYHGLADALVPPEQTVAFHGKLVQNAGGADKVDRFARLFLAPGMLHCGGGAGPNVFSSVAGGATPQGTAQDDLFAALIDWVEHGKAPEQVIATKYVDDAPAKGVAMQRPLCAFPKKAWYKGSGDTNSAQNFVCAVRKP